MAVPGRGVKSLRIEIRGHYGDLWSGSQLASHHVANVTYSRVCDPHHIILCLCLRRASPHARIRACRPPEPGFMNHNTGRPAPVSQFTNQTSGIPIGACRLLNRDSRNELPVLIPDLEIMHFTSGIPARTVRGGIKPCPSTTDSVNGACKPR